MTSSENRPHRSKARTTLTMLTSIFILSVGCDESLEALEQENNEELSVVSTLEAQESELRRRRDRRAPPRQPVVEDPIVEDPVVEDPVVEDPVVEDPVVEDPVVEDPVVEDPVVEDPVVEDPVVEDPVSYSDPRIQEVLDLPSSPHQYSIQGASDHFLNEAAIVDNTPIDNLDDDHRATLGRVLFYDPALSQNQTVSCSSCHQQERGFSDPQRLSEGFAEELTGRHSMSLINVRYYPSGAMFWDERALTLEHQVLGPIQDSVEMGLTLDELVAELQENDYYQPLFTLAFGDPQISSERVSLALSNFVRSIVSHDSPYDAGLSSNGGNPARPFTNFTPEENRGKQLFFAPVQNGGAGCAGCHLAPPRVGPGAPRPTSIFFVNGAANIGLTDGRGDTEDLGVGAVTGRPQDNGKFKAPSLRQVGLTAPYMHDGSLTTLRDVINHYSDGVQAHPNLDPRLRQGRGGAPQRLNLSEADKRALEAFLHTLTDESVSDDLRFSNPFRE